jgi:hypothetical protein
MDHKLFCSMENLPFSIVPILFICFFTNILAQTPSIPPLPSGPSGPGKFGAYYTELKYYPEWDNYWRMGEYADVVVRFDKEGEKFIFWRGTNYIPHWVSENNIWYNNEFTETWETIGSSEPMSDKQCRYSQVRIIESNDARVILHWRYALNDVNYRIAWQDSVTGWGDWCDEIYTIYPDGIGTREVTLYTSHFGDNEERATDDYGHEWQEGIVVYSANKKPEDDVNIDAVHVANMKGDTASWSWEIPGKPKVNIPEGSNIVLMNIKSSLKPFIISPPGCKLDAYEGSQNGSHFRWRDHWPTTLEPTPGRDASGKQAAHGSFFHVTNIPVYRRDDHSITKVMLNGMVTNSLNELIQLAKSWIDAPKVVDCEACILDKFDALQRAYILNAENSAMSFKVEASKNSPVFNPCFLIKNWNQKSDVDLKINNIKKDIVKDYRVGVEHKINGNDDLVIWLELKSEEPFTISILPKTY